MSVESALAALDAELSHWPDHYLSDIYRGCSWSSHRPDGTPITGDGWRSYTWPTGVPTDSWCAEVNQEGLDRSHDRYFAWGKGIDGAIEAVTKILTNRRTNPHTYVHIMDHKYVKGCVTCESEHTELLECDCSDPASHDYE